MYSPNEYNPYFNESGGSGGGGDGGLTQAQSDFINSIPATAYPYIASMNQYVTTTANTLFARTGLDNGLITNPSLYFTSSPSTGLFLDGTVQRFTSVISSRGYAIPELSIPITLGNTPKTTAQGTCIIIGHQSGTLMTSGVENTILGSFGAGQLVNGSNNTLLGYNTDVELGTTSRCVCIGAFSKTGDDAIAIGYSVRPRTDGVGIGTRCMTANSTGVSNTGCGNNTFKLLQSGSRNCAFGSLALENLLSGDDNCCFGYKSGQDNTGINNCFFGVESGNLTTPTASDCIAIGRQAFVNGNYAINIGSDYSNAGQICIGSTNQTACIIPCSLSINQNHVAPAYPLDVNGAIQFANYARIKASTSGVLQINAVAFADYSITLPSTQGIGSLTNDGSGGLTWGTPLYLPLLSEQQATGTFADIAQATTPFWVFYPIASITLKTIRLWIMSSIGAVIGVRIAIYDGTTNALLNQSNNQNTPTDTGYVGEMFVPIPDTQLVQGRKYYIGMDVNSNAGTNKFGATAGGALNYTFWYKMPNDYSTTPPYFPATRPFGTGASNNTVNRMVCALLNYSVTPIP